MADQKNQERCQEVDDYIAGFEAPVRERLEAVRSLVLELRKPLYSAGIP